MREMKKEVKAALISRAEELIDEYNLVRLENNLEKQVAWGSLNGVSCRISIFYRLNGGCVVFTNLCTGERVVKTY